MSPLCLKIVPVDNKHIPGDSVNYVSADIHAYAAICAVQLDVNWPGLQGFILSIQYIDVQFFDSYSRVKFVCYVGMYVSFSASII